MLKENARLFSFLLRVADALVVTLAFAVAFWIRFLSGWLPLPPGVPPYAVYAEAAPFAVLVAVFVFEARGLYRARRIEAGLAEARDVLVGCAVVLLATLALAELYRGRSYSRLFMAAFAVVLPVAVGLERALLRAALRSLRERGWNTRRALVVGDGPLAREVVERLHANAWTGIQIQGVLVLDAKGEGAPGEVGGVPVVGTHKDLERVVRERSIDQVFVAVPLERVTVLRELRPAIDGLVLDVRLVPDTAGLLPIRPGVTELEGLPIVTVRAGPHDGLNGVLKRAVDVAGAAFGLVLFAPVFLGIAAMVRLTSRGPALYRQLRVGWGGRPFVMLKFRTMVEDAEASTGPVRTVRDDPRRTRLGSFLRRTSLDELPQLWNVLRGEMSLVGPRPERPEFLEELRREVPEAMLRLSVRAGMTGLAQVRGLRGDSPLRERVVVDLEYVRGWSLWLDARILGSTVLRGFVHRNAI